MFFIIELQCNEGSDPSYIVKTANTRNEAMSEYYNIMHYAAISNVNIHSCLVINNMGDTVIKDTYFHESEPEVNEE